MSGIRVVLLLFSLLLWRIPVNAQQHKTNDKSFIGGTVTDVQGNPVPYASVALYSVKDSVLAGGVATDPEGEFTIPAAPGNYYLKITFLSFEEKTIQNIEPGTQGKNLGRIIMKPSSLALDAVEIAVEKNQMQLQLDKRVFNVGKDLSNKGGNAAEVLENVPSVSVDIDGNVGLRGSQNVRILIDGKPSGLTGISNSDALRQLQAGMIESVEVITNPSARYDAEGEVGIINIVLKKEKNPGMNGVFEGNTGYPDNYGGSFNINLRKKHINFFSSYGVNYRKSPGSGYSFQEFSGADTSFVYERDREQTRGGLSQNMRIGSDFYLNPNNILTVSALYKYSQGINEANLIYRDFNQEYELIQTVTRTEEEKETDYTTEGAISYLKNFSREGRKLTLDMKWFQSDDTELSDLREESNREIPAVYQRSSNTEDEQNGLLQGDYIHPFGKNGKFETGLKSTFRTIQNEYLVEQQNSGEDWFILEDFNNHFVYDEYIHAAYAMAGTKYRKLSMQGGLRAEYSDISTVLLKTNDINRRSYLDFFPSAHISQELDSLNTIQLSYSRRLSRPRFRELLPFFSFSDSRSFFSGNPNLNPEFTNSFEIGHLKYMEKGSVLSSIYYRYRTGVVERILLTDSNGFTRIFPVNLSIQNAYGLEFNTNYRLSKWWQVNGNFNFYRAITRGEYEGLSLFSDTYTWTARASSKLTLVKKLDFQVSANYRAPEETTQGKRKSMYTVDTGVSIDIFKGNGTLTLSARDLMNSRKRRSVTFGDGFYSESEFQWRSRQILFHFSYRLNQKKNKGNSGKRGDEDEEF